MPVALRRMSLRNRWWFIAKNERLSGFLVRLPFYAALEILILGYLVCREPKVVAAYRDAWRGLRGSFARRPLGGP